MKYMVTWKIDQDKWLPVLITWTSMSPAQRTDVGSSVRLIGRWHNLAARKGVLILDSDDLAGVQKYIGKWNPYMDTAVVPVFDDEESIPVCQSILDNSKSD